MRAVSIVVVAAASLAMGRASAASPASACSGAQYRGLDFWVGDWTAYVPAGQKMITGKVADEDTPIAHASVQSILDGCVYLENWDSAQLPDGTYNRGKGFHHYDAKSGRWRQIWVANNGNEQISVGGPTESGGVQYTSERTNPKGSALVRQTIEPSGDDAVWNHADISIDGGKTWSQAYRYLYKRK